MPPTPEGPILISGASGALGRQIALALAEAGAVPRLWLPPGVAPPPLVHAGWAQAETVDLWNPASLRGRARGAALLLHCAGSLRTDAARGLSARQLNFAAARNAIDSALRDGLPHFLLLSCAPAPWLPRDYRAAKRAAERYLIASGLPYTIIRPPLAYRPGRRPRIFRVLSALGALPGLRGWAPLPIARLARAVARLALDIARADAQGGAGGKSAIRVYGGSELRRLAPAGQGALNPPPAPAAALHPREEAPFGWLPDR